jgi:hypothetical protein
MAKCTYCGSETELFDGGVPICLKCSEQRETKRKPDDGYPSFLLRSGSVPEDLKRRW